MIGLFAAYIISFIWSSVYAHKNYYSFHDVLPSYGFVSEEQRDALKDFFRRASLMGVHESDTFFTKKCTEQELAQELVDLIENMQVICGLRRDSKERWELKPLDWMQQQEEAVIVDLKDMVFIDALTPSLKTVDVICILGATKGRMDERMDYAASLLAEGLIAAKIILLTGERYVTDKVDGSAEVLRTIAEEYGIEDWHDLTEAHLMDYLFKRSRLSLYNLEMYLINTPAGDLPRPTTQTTMLDLIQWLKEHSDVRSIIFVSNQPYVNYQKAIIASILKEQDVYITFEVVGSAAARVSPHALVEGFGSYMWAATPLVLLDLGITVTDPSLINRLKDLYPKNGLLNKVVPVQSQCGIA